MKRNEDSLRDLWDNIKCTNICIIGAPEGEERERKDLRKYLKRKSENVPNMRKEIINKLQEAQRVPGRINPKNTLRHILFKLTKIKDRNKVLNTIREK